MGKEENGNDRFPGVHRCHPKGPEWVAQAEEYFTKGVYCAGAPYNYSCAATATAHRLGRPVGTCFSESTSPYVLFEYIMHRKGQGPIHAH